MLSRHGTNGILRMPRKVNQEERFCITYFLHALLFQ
jgi:hypothetical protein